MTFQTFYFTVSLKLYLTESEMMEYKSVPAANWKGKIWIDSSQMFCDNLVLDINASFYILERTDFGKALKYTPNIN